ncbi:DUF4245 domain-containing protein [Streptosporangium sp. NBC_01756]|uniref:DUF4245 domain-containing protein n=1 Tax=Streptosporangium sp. NBC_01756 TaxID=2975950 RepID=UPI002DDC03E6|nr:DUF4245 domain-containing protein [Streptosporangium sp. NBC_01756]WSC89266.1 DUF4245 domain-containing protein [Streptosporangium sp. NBC_01756]
MERFTQGFYGYAVAMLVCLAGVGVFLLVTPQSRTEHIPKVDYSIDVANMRHTAPYQTWSPEPVPAGWIPTSSRVTNEKGVVSWRLGFATAKRSHAMLAQSDEKPAAEFANRMANTGEVVGSVQVGGVTWEQRLRKDKDQRSLVRLLPDVTVVVTGTAQWDELSALAGSLKQQAKTAS